MSCRQIASTVWRGQCDGMAVPGSESANPGPVAPIGPFDGGIGTNDSVGRSVCPSVFPMKTMIDSRKGSLPRRFWLVTGAVGIAGLMTLGCKPARVAITDTVAPGVYTLVSVDGNPVPAQVKHDGHTIEVRCGTFTFDSGGSCRSHTVFVPGGGREVVRDVEATYTQSGNHLKMKWKGAGTTEGTIEGSTFTLNNEGMRFVYRQ